MICPACLYDNVPGAEECAQCQLDLSQLDLPAPHDRIEESLMQDPVSVLAPKEPVVVRPTATVREALQTMLQHNLGAILVVDDAGKLQGIFSERDLVKKVAGERRSTDVAVGSVMTPNPETVRATDTLGFALHKMDVGGYRHLPILFENHTMGVISVRDMLRHITRLCKE